MSTNKNNQNESPKEGEVVISKSELFFRRYRTVLTSIVVIILVAGFGGFAYNKFIYAPKCNEACEAAMAAFDSFQAGDYELALNGDGNVSGFVQIIEDYGSKAGEIVYLNAGVCEYKLGNYEEALKYLEAYDSKDEILSAKALACQGDCYVNLEQYEKAASLFEKAASVADNDYSAEYLVKAGLTYRKLEDKESALKCFETVADKYPQSMEAYDIDKYIATVKE